MGKNSFVLPPIPPEELTPTVQLLLAIIEQQQVTTARLEARIDQLEAEVARLKKLPPRPKIKPSTLGKDDDEDPPAGGSNHGSSISKRQRPGSKKRHKRIKVHRSVIIPPQDLSPGSCLLGYQDYLVQDLLIEPCNTRYRLARYRTPDGVLVTGQLPVHLQGTHFGPTLQSYIIYQYHHQRVTQPLLLQQLREWDIDISSGQISHILTESTECFHAEKDELLSAGINHSTYIHVDDTGSRHDGKNGYCTHIGNDAFAWFSSTQSKSRINFLELLRGPVVDYTINPAAIDYMRAQGLPQGPLDLIGHSETKTFGDEKTWKVHLKRLKITHKRPIRIATEGALLGALSACGFPPDLVIISDDAGQFNILLHALCWIHANRVFQRILPLNQTHTKELNWVHTQIWEIYSDLKQYKRNPNPDLKVAIQAHFDELCRTKTSFGTLNQALKRLACNKKELLLVLQRPDIPLHNNLSERDIREYVIKRKISGSTRSENGRRCRDTFTSLKKTCKKQRIAFWNFLGDRLRRKHLVPYLPDLLCGNVCILPDT